MYLILISMDLGFYTFIKGWIINSTDVLQYITFLHGLWLCFNLFLFSLGRVIPRPKRSRWSWVSYSVCLRYLLREQGLWVQSKKFKKCWVKETRCVCVRPLGQQGMAFDWCSTRRRRGGFVTICPASSRELCKLSWASASGFRVFSLRIFFFSLPQTTTGYHNTRLYVLPGTKFYWKAMRCYQGWMIL